MKLKPFQVTGANQIVSFLKTNPGGGAYLADEMGLGKTAQAIEACNIMGFKRVLVIAPAVVVTNWVQEIEMWMPPSSEPLHLQNERITIETAASSTTIKKLRAANWAITTYGLAAKPENAQELSEGLWECLILDESHYLKTTSSQRSKSILKLLWPKIPYKICLSGTPITDSVMDGYTLFSRLAPNDPHLTSWHSFGNRYAKRKTVPWGAGFEFYGLKEDKADELSKKIRENFFIRRLKKDVQKELPDKIFTRITLPKKYCLKLPKDEAEALRHQARALADAIEKNKPLPVIPATLQGKRRAQGVLKVKPAVEFIEYFLEQKIPVVVFAYHREVMESLRANLILHSPSLITGDTPTKIRGEQVENFQNGNTNLFLGQIIAAGIGINLTRASHVVLIEHDWTPSNILQAIDRAHRLTTKDTVNVYSLVVEGSLDERIIDVLVAKAQTIERILD